MSNTVLVVDDMEINRDILTEILNEEYRVETAENGQRALEMIEEKQDELALVLLDLMMPEVDGLEACMRIREFSNVPIIGDAGEGMDRKDPGAHHQRRDFR